jgi:hypothetical protein
MSESIMIITIHETNFELTETKQLHCSCLCVFFRLVSVTASSNDYIFDWWYKGIVHWNSIYITINKYNFTDQVYMLTNKSWKNYIPTVVVGNLQWDSITTNNLKIFFQWEHWSVSLLVHISRISSRELGK